MCFPVATIHRRNFLPEKGENVYDFQLKNHFDKYIEIFWMKRHDLSVDRNDKNIREGFKKM